MADRDHDALPEKVSWMVQRAGLSLPTHQIEALCSVFERIQGAAQRIKRGLQRSDEPAVTFRLWK